MTRKRIFIDLDGVLVDWEGSALKVLGLESDLDIKEQLKNGEKLEDLFPQIYEEIESMGENFWTNLEKYSWCDELIERAQNSDGEVAFLSSAGNPYGKTKAVADAIKGKILYVSSNFKNIPLILTREKYLCASPRSILIDDTKKKVDDFIVYGGSGFLWPHPYALELGEISIQETFSKLAQQIKKL